MMRILGAALVAAWLAAPAIAQDAAPAALDPDEAVLATVDGTPITASDLATAYGAIGDAVERVPPAQRDEMLLSLLVDMQLMADAAEGEGIAQRPAFQKRLGFMRKQALQEEYMNDIIGTKITDAAVASRYQEEAGNLPKEQISASHILVADEAKAQDLIAQLGGGADFAALALENSTDPGSAANGGALGFFSPGQMVPEFEQAATALEIGKITVAPVKSEFGWHVIRLDDKREFPVPPLAEVQDEIKQVLVREAYIAQIEALKAAATIERAGTTVSGGTAEPGPGPANPATVAQ